MLFRVDGQLELERLLVRMPALAARLAEGGQRVRLPHGERRILTPIFDYILIALVDEYQLLVSLVCINYIALRAFRRARYASDAQLNIWT